MELFSEQPPIVHSNQTIYHQSITKSTSDHDLVEVTPKLSQSVDQATKWYKSNLLARNLKKYQTFNIGDLY